MSTSSPQSSAAGEQQLWQALLSQNLSDISMPELKSLTGQLGGMLGSRDSSGRMAADAQILSSAQGQLNQGYNQAQTANREAIGYNALRSGEGRLSPGATGSAIEGAATGLERDRQAALRNLQFQSAQTSLQDYNQVLGLLGQGAGTSLGLAQGFSGAAGSAIGGLSSQSQMGGILGGAAGGAGIGATFGPWGALAGGVIGGVAGGLATP